MPAMDDAPIVGGDDVVETGNAHVRALRRSYAEDPENAARYRQAIEARGFDTARFKQPVLIRRRMNALTPEQRAGFVRGAEAGNGPAHEAGLTAAYGPALARLIRL